MSSPQKSSPSPTPWSHLSLLGRARLVLWALRRHPIQTTRLAWDIYVLNLSDDEIAACACTRAIETLAMAGVPAVYAEASTGARLTWVPAPEPDHEPRDLPEEVYDLDRARLRRERP